MPTQETKIVIDSLLNQANKAVIDRQWNTVQVLAEEVLKLDEQNNDAQSLINTTVQNLTLSPPTVSATIILPDPDLPELPSDPKDAVYFSVHPTQFVGGFCERFTSATSKLAIRGLNKYYASCPEEKPRQTASHN